MHPRDPAALLYEEDVAADQAYPPYSAEVWPSALELAYAVSAHDWSGAAVLELGAAWASRPSQPRSPGRGARRRPFRRRDHVAAVNAEREQRRRRDSCVLVVEPGPLIARAPWRLVLASDVLYGQRNVDELLDLLPRLVGDDGAAWIADPQRPLTEGFLAAAGRRVALDQTTPTRKPQVLIHHLTGPVGRAPPQ